MTVAAATLTDIQEDEEEGRYQPSLSSTSQSQQEYQDLASGYAGTATTPHGGNGPRLVTRTS